MDRNHEILGHTLLFVTAHPDDESYLASGTIWRNRQLGGSSVMLCATLGEKGTSHLKKKVSGAQLKQIRKAELVKVSKFLGVEQLITYNFPDGGLKNHVPEFAEKIFSAIKKFSPEYIISFGEDGISGHLDHIAAGRAAKIAAKKFKLPLLIFTRPPKIASKAKHWFRKRQRNGVYKEEFEYSKPDVYIDIDSVVKLKAIMHHKSQIEDGNPFVHIPKFAVNEILKAEYFAKG